MSVQYNPSVGPGITSVRQSMYSRIDIPIDDLSILNGDDLDAQPGEIDSKDILKENLNYGPAIGVDYAPDAKSDNTDLTDLNKDNVTNDPLLTPKSSDKESVMTMDTTKMVNYVPSAIVDYYNEAALTANKRNKLSDKDFGLPRTRQYPLHDEAHVKQAVRMFGHCKDPEDRKTLASRIFAKIREFNLDIKIGKKNPLYQYTPKDLMEAVQVPESDDDDYKIFGLEVPMDKRTKDDIVKEHIRINGNFYNTLFFGDEYARSIKQLKEFEFFEYFYPNLKSHNFYQRLKGCLGGLATDRELYKMLKIRYPLDVDDFNSPLGDVEMTDELSEAFYLYIQTSYIPESNWFKTSARDHDHILYCLRIYSIMGLILNDPNFTIDRLGPKHIGILLDWEQHIHYHYDHLMECAEHEDCESAQYLFDLFWNFHENPADPGSITGNIAAMCTQMASAKTMTIGINEATDMISKEDCVGYMVKELGMDDDIFLLPGTMEYPVINQNSVRMAMDIIRKIDKENIPEYTKNLNRKYRELGCKFSISVDHPYAQYADQMIIDNMTHILMEGETSVNDHGTSSGTQPPVEQPWFVRNDVTGTVGRDILANKELGPNDKKYPSPDYERNEALL